MDVYQSNGLTYCGVALVALLALLVAACASSGGEKVVEHPIPRLYGADDPQFSRTMGALLGPGLLEGNRVDVLLNGDEIFPASNRFKQSLRLRQPAFSCAPSTSPVRDPACSSRPGSTGRRLLRGLARREC